MFKNKSVFYSFLGIIFIVALFLRIYQLDSFPVGFHIDEASLGYNGYSLLLTGKDDNNNRLPLYIDMFGDNRPSGYHYLTILPIKIFGLTEFATRLPGAFFGSISIFAIFFLVSSIFQDKKLSLLTALFLAISPWHISLSRASAEAIVGLFFILLGFSLVIVSLRKEKIQYIVAGAFSLSLSFFFYHTPRAFVPLLFVVLAITLLSVWTKTKIIYKTTLMFSFLSLSSLALLLVFFVSGGTGRFSQVNIFSSFDTDFAQKQQIQEDSVAKSPHILSRFFHNKLANTSLIFISNYLDYFGFNFLFIKGGLPIWYSIPRMGLVYLVELPFILIGVYYLIRSRNIYYKIPILWFLTAPVVAATTMDDVPNINRSLVILPALELISAFGLLSSASLIKPQRRIIFLSSCGLFLLLNNLYFLHQYFFNAKTHNPWYRNNGFSAMMREVKNNYDNYDLIAMSKYQGGIYPLVLFYMQYDPKQYQAEGSPKNKDYKGFGKFFFVPQDCPSIQARSKVPIDKRALFVDKGDCIWEKSFPAKRHSYIYRGDKTKAFSIVYD